MTNLDNYTKEEFKADLIRAYRKIKSFIVSVLAIIVLIGLAFM